MESQIHYENCKNGDLTCSFQGKYLHSKYNPKNEGERFVQSMQADFSPLCVFIIEPALSYCAPFLRQKFPESKICAIRICKDFSETDKYWDFVFYPKEINGYSDFSTLGEDLFNSFGEEGLISSLFFDWTPTKQTFIEESKQIWQEIKETVLKSRDVIATRSYFSKRWLKNTLIFTKHIQNALTLNKTSLPIIIAASGPSLKSSIPYLTKFRDSFVLIAVSSAFMPLSKHSITPDIVISSDGGFWAKKHLDFHESDSAETIFAIEAEGAVPKKILTEKKIIPLIYSDGFEKNFLDAIDCPYMISERNGTIAGTALKFALSLTRGNVYISGFDQAPSPSFQHTQPNALENDNAKKDFRLRNTETRITSSRFNSEGSLRIYRNWFISNSSSFSKRVFRLSDNFKYEYGLGEISEINWDDFAKKEKTDFSAGNQVRPEQKSKKIELSINERNKIIFSELEKLIKTDFFKREVFPMDTILIKRENSDERKKLLEEKLDVKLQNLLKEISG